jgi:hypothetical protein
VMGLSGTPSDVDVWAVHIWMHGQIAVQSSRST